MQKSILNLTLIILLVGPLSVACQKIDADYCDDLAFKTFKGHPPSAHKYKKNCLKIKHKYTKELCQKALKDLVVVGNENKMRKNYGQKIMMCFSQNDLKRFLRK